MVKGRILVVDDLPDVRETLVGLLFDEGYEVHSASSRAHALQMVEAGYFQVAVLDMRLDDTDEENKEGLLLMHDIKQRDPAVAVIILTGYSDVKTVREALEPDHQGVSPAFGFLEKTEIDQLVKYVDRAMTRRRLTASVADLVAQGENDRVEFKSTLRHDLRTNQKNRSVEEAAAAAIAGMLNSEGGVLLIGVADDGTILGIEPDLKTLRKKNTDGFQLALTDIVETYLGLEFMTHIRTRFEVVEGKQVCVVTIAKSPKPVFSAAGDAHKFWVRTGNATRHLDPKETVNYIQAHWENQK